jgi:AcrR family transcriptional regulator
MKEEGYPAVTTRRLASRMGVSNQLVHYYFRTMDDLFLSLMRRGAERSMSRLLDALTSDEPLWGLLKLYSDSSAAKLQIEYLALINHRKEVSREAVRNSEHLRALEAEALGRILNGSRLDLRDYPSNGMAVILSAIGRIIAIEETVGISLGHKEAVAILERVIKSLGTTDRLKSRKGRKLPDSHQFRPKTKRQARARIRIHR